MNSVSISGRVVRTWNVAGDTFYRVISQRRPGMLPNPDGKNFDALTVRFPNALGHAPIWTEGTDVEVVGYIQQMDTETPLVRLVEQRRVKGLGRTERAALAEKVDGLALTESRIEVVAERWHIVRHPTAEERERRGQRDPQRGPQPRRDPRPEKPAPVAAPPPAEVVTAEKPQAPRTRKPAAAKPPVAAPAE